MHIKSLTASIKGRTFSHDLQPLVLITGPNFSGKTARTAAIRLALNGTLPELGGRPNDALALGAMHVAAKVEFTGGLVIDRQWNHGKTPSTVVNLEKMTPEGGPITVDSFSGIPLLDPEAYFGKTSNEQVNYVFSMIAPPEECTAPNIIARIRNISIDEDSTAAHEEARGWVVQAVEKVMKMDGVNQGLNELTKDKGTLKTEYTHWNRRQKDTLGAVRTLAELKTRENECSAFTLAELDTKLAGYREELAKAQTAIGAIRERSAAALRVQKRRTELDGLLAVPPHDSKQSIADKTVTLNTLKADLATLSHKWEAGISPSELQPAEQAANQAKIQKAQEVQTLRLAVATALQQLEELQKHACCPFCKSKGRGWKKSLETFLTKTRDEHQASLAIAEAEFVELADAHTQAKATLDERIRDEKAGEELLRRIRGVENEIERLNYGATQAATVLKAQQDELANLQQVESPTEDETREAADELSEAEDDVAAAEATRNRAISLQHDLKRAAEAETEHKKAAAFLAVIKAAGTALVEIKAGFVEKVFGKLLDTANGLFGDLLLSPLAYHDGEIGRWQDGAFVTTRVFSGTETALTYIAIATALSAKAPFRLVLLDELGRLDEFMQYAVLERLVFAQETGIIDQAIVLCPVALEMSGWQHIDLNPQEAK